MSLFLGKIHFWLFDKIKYFEALEREIIDFAKIKGHQDKIDKEYIYQKIGRPTQEKPLEEQIDTSNIHGWLQEQIQKAELRQAYIIKTLLDIDKRYKNELKELFENNGRKIGLILGVDEDLTPRKAYDILNNYLLEGMPCDRTTDFLEDNEQEFSFSYARCLHKKYWDEFNADIKDFYELRNAWISGFIKAINKDMVFVVDAKDESYKNISENVFSIMSV